MQAKALTELYIATKGVTWTVSSSWMVGDPCVGAWTGVVCATDNTSVTYVPDYLLVVNVDHVELHVRLC